MLSNIRQSSGFARKHTSNPRRCFHERFILSSNLYYALVNFSLVACAVAYKVLNFFVRASIATVGRDRVLKMIQANLLMTSTAPCENHLIETKTNVNFRKNSQNSNHRQLFDTAYCTLPMTFHGKFGREVDFCSCPVCLKCSCDKSRKSTFPSKVFVRSTQWTSRKDRNH